MSINYIINLCNYKNHPNITTESGSKGGKIFILKWGFSIKFFKKFILKSDIKYDGPLNEPTKNMKFYLYLLLNKINYFWFSVKVCKLSELKNGSHLMLLMMCKLK